MRTLCVSFREARQRQQRMRKIARMRASYRFKLNAMLMVDQREGVKVNNKGDMWDSRHDLQLPEMPLIEVEVVSGGVALP